MTERTKMSGEDRDGGRCPDVEWFADRIEEAYLAGVSGATSVGDAMAYVHRAPLEAIETAVEVALADFRAAGKVRCRCCGERVGGVGSLKAEQTIVQAARVASLLMAYARAVRDGVRR